MRKIALVGTASSGAGAPYGDDSFEIWGVSSRASYVTRANRWFELHRLDGEEKDWAQKWRQQLHKQTRDIETLYMLWPESWLGDIVKEYPHNEITSRFGSYFFTSTFSWMMALAINEMRPKGCSTEVNGDEISIFGVDMEFDTEYEEQRNGFKHFINLARALGIIVTLDIAGGMVFEPCPYPFWQDDPLTNRIKKRSDYGKAAIADLDRSLNDTNSMITQNNAIIRELDRIKKGDYDFKGIDIRLSEISKEQKKLVELASKLEKELLVHEGAQSVHKWLERYLRG